MKQVKLTDFSGGFKVGSSPQDFQIGQWAKLYGVMPSDDGLLETQWANFHVGDLQNVHEVYPLETSSRLYLLALADLNQDSPPSNPEDYGDWVSAGFGIYWCDMGPTSTRLLPSDVVNKTWTLLTTCENVDLDGDAYSITLGNPHTFLTKVPLQSYKYSVNVDPADEGNPNLDVPKDDDYLASTGVMVGLKHSVYYADNVDGGTGPSYSNQSILGEQVYYIVYVDADAEIRVIRFPNVRRLPLRVDGNPANSPFLKFKTADGYTDAADWFENSGSTSFPYTYVNEDGALLPGSGVIPTGKVATTKNGLMLIGNVAWRSNKAESADEEPGSEYLVSTSGEDEFTTKNYELIWPDSLPGYGRVIYNEGPGTLYIRSNGTVLFDVVDYDVNNGTATLTTRGTHDINGDPLIDVLNTNDVANVIGGNLNSASGSSVSYDKTYTGHDIDQRSSSGTTRTLRTKSNHNLVIGQYVTISGVNANYNGNFAITGTTPNTFSYTAGGSLSEGATSVSPVGEVDVQPTPISHIYGDGEYVTFYTTYVHGFQLDTFVNLESLSGSSTITGLPSVMNGVHRIVEIPDSKSFRIKYPYSTSIRIINRSYNQDQEKAVIRTQTTHNFSDGEDVVIAGLGSTVFNGTWGIQAITLTAPTSLKEKNSGIVTITFPSSYDHSFIVGDEIEVEDLGANYDGTFTITAVDYATRTIEYDFGGTQTLGSTSDTDGTVTYIQDSNLVSGNVFQYDAEFATDFIPKVVTRLNALATSKMVATGTAFSPVGQLYVYDTKVLPGEYQSIPDLDTPYVLNISTTLPRTKVKAVPNYGTAYSTLNSGNVAEHVGSLYFSTGEDIDQFDPRGVLQVARGNSEITGMHMLNDTVVVLTDAEAETDGIYAINGYFSRLIDYAGPGDPNAVRIDLLRGGVGTASFLNNGGMGPISTVWSDAGTVAFIGKDGNLWATNGQSVERLNRQGPTNDYITSGYGTYQPACVATVGNRLFYVKSESGAPRRRFTRLFCLTLLDNNGGAVWTEISNNRGFIPTGLGEGEVTNLEDINYIVGSSDCLFGVDTYLHGIGGRVFCSSGRTLNDHKGASFDHVDFVSNLDVNHPEFDPNDLPNGVYFKYNTLEIKTPLLGDLHNNRRFNWHKVSASYVPLDRVDGNDTYYSIVSESNFKYVVPWALTSAPDFDANYGEDHSENFSGDNGRVGEITGPVGLGPVPTITVELIMGGPVRFLGMTIWYTGDSLYNDGVGELG